MRWNTQFDWRIFVKGSYWLKLIVELTNSNTCAVIFSKASDVIVRDLYAFTTPYYWFEFKGFKTVFSQAAARNFICTLRPLFCISCIANYIPRSSVFSQNVTWHSLLTGSTCKCFVLLIWMTPTAHKRGNVLSKLCKHVPANITHPYIRDYVLAWNICQSVS